MHTPEQRLFSRIQFHHGARIVIAGRQIACEVIDLSLKGALLNTAAPLDIPAGTECALELVLDDGLSVVRMEGQVAHCESSRFGLVCQSIDIDSITHLRRLLELNLGDAELLEREFAALQHD